MKTRKMLLFGAIAIAILFAAVFALRYYQNTASPSESETQALATGMYAYRLSEKDIGGGWQLIQEYKNLAEWPLDQQKTFAADGIVDAAGWKYAHGNETLHVWARNFNTLDELVKVESEKVSVSPYEGSAYWKDVSELPQYGEMARIGVFDVRNNKEYTSLFLYVAQNKTMFFVQYANQLFNGHERYEKALVENKSNLFDDKRFLISTFKKIEAKSATNS